MLLTTLSRQEFGDLVEPHRHELQVHCYRMLATTQDAEDMVQETFLRAWKRRDTFRHDTSFRAWLYAIATNACLDVLKKHRRRLIPQTMSQAHDPALPVLADVLEPIWLEPYPDELLITGEAEPEALVLEQERIRIAFIAVLQLLPPRQRAVLLLSDVLEWSASEIAGHLGTTISAVKSALSRARSSLAARQDMFGREGAHHAIETSDELPAVLEHYVRAWENADVDSLIELLSDDSTFSMPPIPSWYRGKDAIRAVVSRTIFAGQAVGRWRLVPARANLQPAFGLYRISPSGGHEYYGIQLLTVQRRAISDIITFRGRGNAQRFSLPDQL